MHLAQHEISGTIQIPASKSLTQRAYACALLFNGITEIQHAGHSQDEQTALSIVQQLGASGSIQDNNTIIRSNGKLSTLSSLHCGESGLCTRMFLPILATTPNCYTITGKGSLLKRKMEHIDQFAHALQLQLKSNNDYLPLTIQGPIKGSHLVIDGRESSQYLTGLLIALAYTCTTDMHIEVQGLVSKPYIDLTLQLLSSLGMPIKNEHYQHFYISPKKSHPSTQNISIESDWSSASNFIVLAAIKGKIQLKGLYAESVQADKAILKVLDQVGSNIEWKATSLHIEHHKNNPFAINIVDCPDLFPILCVLAGTCSGTSSIKGIHRLTHKESNRLVSCSTMMQQLGIPFAIQDDTVLIEGVAAFNGASIDSCNDHRIAMAASIASAYTKDPITIIGEDAVNKSYPNFFNDLKLLIN
jgi:3-phosphoshikimate 1-carboxyvinyltransferase